MEWCFLQILCSQCAYSACACFLCFAICMLSKVYSKLPPTQRSTVDLPLKYDTIERLCILVQVFGPIARGELNRQHVFNTGRSAIPNAMMLNQHMHQCAPAHVNMQSTI